MNTSTCKLLNLHLSRCLHVWFAPRLSALKGPGALLWRRGRLTEMFDVKQSRMCDIMPTLPTSRRRLLQRKKAQQSPRRCPRCIEGGHTLIENTLIVSTYTINSHHVACLPLLLQPVTCNIFRHPLAAQFRKVYVSPRTMRTRYPVVVLVRKKQEEENIARNNHTALLPTAVLFNTIEIGQTKPSSNNFTNTMFASLCMILPGTTVLIWIIKGYIPDAPLPGTMMPLWLSPHQA